MCLSLQLLVSSQTSPGSDDMYLEGQSSGGIPSDDEDDETNISGSGMSEFGKNAQTLATPTKINRHFKESRGPSFSCSRKKHSYVLGIITQSRGLYCHAG
jgi:hypothetical protein